MTYDQGGRVTATSTPLREIANPAAVGWEWTDTYEGFGTYRHQVCWIRGTESLQYGTQLPHAARWSQTTIDQPERFGFDGTLQGARRAAQAFYDETHEEGP